MQKKEDLQLHSLADFYSMNIYNLEFDIAMAHGSFKEERVIIRFNKTFNQ